MIYVWFINKQIWFVITVNWMSIKQTDRWMNFNSSYLWTVICIKLLRWLLARLFFFYQKKWSLQFWCIFCMIVVSKSFSAISSDQTGCKTVKLQTIVSFMFRVSTLPCCTVCHKICNKICSEKTVYWWDLSRRRSYGHTSVVLPCFCSVLLAHHIWNQS